MAEIEAGAPMFQAVVVKTNVTPVAVVCEVRYHRKSIFDGKRKTFQLEVPYGSGEYQRQKYELAKKLKPGDELYVDGYGVDCCDAVYHNVLQRRWNLKFA